MRYIDADDCLEKIRPVQDEDTKSCVLISDAKRLIVNFIKDAPTADVVPKSEVAREIFKEIDKKLDEARLKYRNQLDSNGVIYINYARVIIAELKKKYTEERE